MSYLGKTPVIGKFNKIDPITGFQNGVETEFVLRISDAPFTPETAYQMIVVKNGEILEPDVDFSVSSYNISFVTPPLSNDAIFIIAFGQALFSGVPSAGTVDSEAIADASIGYDKLGRDAVSTILGNIITFGI